MASLHQLRCFLAAHRLGSFTAAAAELGLSQPSVSEQVRLLERHLRTALFVRAGRGLTPTEAGTTFAPYAERALGVVSDGLAAVRSVRDLESGTVRLGVFGTARTYFGGDLAANILARYPNVRIELIGQNSTEVVSMVRAGQLEAGLVTLPVDDEQLTVAPVARDENVYVSAEPPAGPVSTEQLLRARLVLAQATWGPADSTRRQLIERARRVRRPPRRAAWPPRAPGRPGWTGTAGGRRAAPPRTAPRAGAAARPSAAPGTAGPAGRAPW